jgi:general stress protein CsbA
MQYSIPPNRRDPRNIVFTILRIALWLMPAIFIPISLIILGLLSHFLRIEFDSYLLILCVLSIIAATAAVGYFDQRISLMQKKIVPPHSKLELARWTTIFVLTQIIIAPTVCYVMVYTYWTVGSRYW